MKKSPEIQHLENSIAALVSSITDAINSRVQTAVIQDVQATTKTLVDPAKKSPIPPGFIDFNGLSAAVPLSERTLRELIKRGQITTIRLPGGCGVLFNFRALLGQSALLTGMDGLGIKLQLTN